MSEPLKIPKRAVAVALRVDGGQEQPATLFIPPSGPSSDELVVHRLLEEESRFIPCRQEGSTGGLLNKDRILLVTVPLVPKGHENDQEEGALPELFDVYQRIEVSLAGKETVEGDLLFSAPEEQRRVGDYLNQRERFLPVYQQERVLLINKRFIVSAREKRCAREE